MDLGLKASENPQDRLVLTLNRRDLVLLNLCLEVVAHDHTKGGNLHFDIESTAVS